MVGINGTTETHGHTEHGITNEYGIVMNNDKLIRQSFFSEIVRWLQIGGLRSTTVIELFQQTKTTPAYNLTFAMLLILVDLIGITIEETLLSCSLHSQSLTSARRRKAKVLQPWRAHQSPRAASRPSCDCWNWR